MTVRPVKTQLSLDIPPSLIRVFAVRMKKPWAFSYPLSAQRRLWSDWADAQADLSLRWAHIHFVGFVMSRLKWSTTWRHLPFWFVFWLFAWNGKTFLIFTSNSLIHHFHGSCYIIILTFSRLGTTPFSWFPGFHQFLQKQHYLEWEPHHCQALKEKQNNRGE